LYSLAGTFGAVLTCPLEVIKTRYQSSQNAFSQEQTQNNLKSSMGSTTTHNASFEMKRPSILVHFGIHLNRLFGFFFINNWKFRHILKYEGFPGLFKGLIPNLIGVAPSR